MNLCKADLKDEVPLATEVQYPLRKLRYVVKVSEGSIELSFLPREEAAGAETV